MHEAEAESHSECDYESAQSALSDQHIPAISTSPAQQLSFQTVLPLLSERNFEVVLPPPARIRCGLCQSWMNSIDCSLDAEIKGGTSSAASLAFDSGSSPICACEGAVDAPAETWVIVRAWSFRVKTPRTNRIICQARVEWNKTILTYRIAGLSQHRRPVS